MATSINQPPPPVNKTNYLPWILGGCGAVFVLGVVVVIAAVGIYYYNQPSTNSRTGGRRSSSGVHLVEDHGIQTVPKTWSSCTAYAPADWTIIGNEQRVGIGVDLAAPDQSMSASYGIVAVPRTGMYGRDYYGTGTPEKAIQTMMEATGNTGFVLDDESQSVEGYTLRYWRAVLLSIKLLSLGSRATTSSPITSAKPMRRIGNRTRTSCTMSRLPFDARSTFSRHRKAAREGCKGARKIRSRAKCRERDKKR